MVPGRLVPLRVDADLDYLRGRRCRPTVHYLGLTALFVLGLAGRRAARGRGASAAVVSTEARPPERVGAGVEALAGGQVELEVVPQAAQHPVATTAVSARSSPACGQYRLTWTRRPRSSTSIVS